MRTLVVTAREPRTKSSGYDLRVNQLASLTPGQVHLVVVPLDLSEPRDRQSSSLPGFRTVRHITDLALASERVRRHVRLSNHRYLRLSRPGAFARATRQLVELLDELEIDWLVVFSGDLAEVAVATGHPRTILDVCDSASLTRRRELEVLTKAASLQRFKARIDLARSRSLEARLPGKFRTVTTISEQDSSEVRGLAGTASNVVTIPNGVDDAYLGGMLPPGRRRGVAFWGNLDFGPNVEAMRYFLVEVYQPYLRDHGVHVRIVGAKAPDWLVRMAGSDRQIELLGFVDDLRSAVADFPVAVNAMRTGSGLKNKVLEAFGMGLAVVTTTRGVEALASVRGGAHVRVADDAQSFARAVIDLLDDADERSRIRSAAHALLLAEYPWPVIGESWRALFDEGPAAVR